MWQVWSNEGPTPNHQITGARFIARLKKQMLSKTNRTTEPHAGAQLNPFLCAPAADRDDLAVPSLTLRWA